jgi:hypothetical protein
MEPTGWNYNIFEFSKIWSENPRVGSLCAFGAFDRPRRLKFCPSAPEFQALTKFFIGAFLFKGGQKRAQFILGVNLT